ncbi:hypothetical protein VKT23_015078 [Stygiomarasmius scandens]|uniref:Uncharacterized protein n=1 Tax=Marasmiellus scandens TaxID=2682957 RepID=A0ABR1IYJ8_9AGAR
MAYRLQKQRPLITKRMSFTIQPDPPKPNITARCEFGSDYLQRRAWARLQSENSMVLESPPTSSQDSSTPKQSNEEKVSDANVRGASKEPTPTPIILSHAAQNPPAHSSQVLPYQPESEGTSDTSDDEDSVQQSLSFIPKPPGEAGKPGAGGYKLEDTLIKKHSWTPADYQLVYGACKKLCLERLDTSANYRRQDDTAKLDICTKIMNQYSITKGYEDCWPVRDMMKSVLKNRKTGGRA